MSSIKSKKSEEQRLKEFGLVMCLALTIISGVFLWKGRSVALISIGLAVVFLVSGVFAPRILDPFERRWMQLAEKMSIVVSWIIVTLTFYLVIAPMGIIMRLFGADLLKVKLEPERESYWEPVEEDGPGSRPYLPY